MRILRERGGRAKAPSTFPRPRDPEQSRSCPNQMDSVAMACMPIQCASVPLFEVALSSATTAQDSGSETLQITKQLHAGRTPGLPPL